VAPPNRSRRRAVTGLVLALAAIGVAAWIQQRWELPRPGEGRAADTAPTARATRTARSLARLEALDPGSPRSPVVLNEIATVNRDSVFDEDLAPSDWIELFNRGEASVALAGWSLVDGRTSSRRWILPDVKLAPGEHLLVFASGKDRAGSALARTVGAVLDPRADGERLLLDPPRRVVDPNAETAAVGLVRVALEAPDAGPYELWIGARAPGPGPSRLRVTLDKGPSVEVALQPSRRRRHLRVATGIEGPGPQEIRFEVRDGAVELERVSLARAGRDHGRRGLHLHSGFRLRRNGETLVLLDPAGRAADYATPERFVPGETWQRVPDGGSDIRYAPPTPLGRALAPAPDLSGFPSVSRDPLVLHVELPPGVDELRHTLDGSLPGADSARLPRPLRVKGPAVLRVRGFRDGRAVTPVASRILHVGAPPDQLVVMLGIDPRVLHDPEFGIVPNNAGRGVAWERPARVLILDAGGVTFDGEAGLRSHSGTGSDKGRENSFQLRLRPSLGAERLPRDPFEPVLAPAPDRLILDATAVAWVDKVAYDLVRAAGGLAARSRPAVLFVNGVHHNRIIAFEDVDDDFLTGRFGHADFDLIKGKPFKVKKGDLQRLDALAARLESGEMSLADLEAELDLDGAVALHFTRIFIDAPQAGTFEDDALQGYVAVDRRRAPGFAYLVAWDLDKGFRTQGEPTLARQRAFLGTRGWFPRFVAEKALDQLLRGDAVFQRWYAEAAERFLAVAAEPRWAALLDELESLERTWAMPRTMGPVPDEERRQFLERRSRLFQRARRTFAERPDELRRMVAEAVGGGS
jgi:hypothetical protein